VRTVVKKFGTIHILVNNAGGPPVETFDRLSDDHWEKGVQTDDDECNPFNQGP